MHACARWDPQTGRLGQRRTAHRRSPKISEVNVGRYKHVLVWEASEVHPVRVQHRRSAGGRERPPAQHPRRKTQLAVPPTATAVPS